MTLKCGFIGKAQGGAKAGVRFDSEAPLMERRECLASFGKAVAPILRKRLYIPGTDVGTTHADVQYLLQVVGAPVRQRELIDFQTGYYTALTAFTAAKAAIRFLGMGMPACRVAIEGYGKVGMALAELFQGAGSCVVAVSTSLGALYNPKGLDIKSLSQLYSKAGSRLVELYDGAERLNCSALLELPVDILSPCATRHTLHMGNVSQVKARVLCPGANNPITPEAENMLFERGVLCLPDFVTNCGGVLGGTMGFAALETKHIVSLIAPYIENRITWLLKEAARSHALPRDIAVPIARRRFEEMRRAPDNATLRARLLAFGVELYACGWVPRKVVAPFARRYFERLLMN
jgi:glutamate dehydrogenase/leucine dehydrogenase